MDSPPNHPSFLELDRARLGSASAQTSAHLEGCERCQAHLRTLEAPVAIPPWARELAKVPSRPWWKFWEGWRFPIAGAIPVALAAILLAVVVGPRLYPRTRIALDEQPFGDKGPPAFELHIKRAGQLSLWDGQSPIHPGDHLQLEVKGSGYGFVAVAEAAKIQGPLLYSGPLERARSTMLPASWAVDAEPGPEQLLVAVSQRPLTPADLVAAATTQRRDDSIWTTVLVLPKATEPAEPPP